MIVIVPLSGVCVVGLTLLISIQRKERVQFSRMKFFKLGLITATMINSFVKLDWILFPLMTLGDAPHFWILLNLVIQGTLCTVQNKDFNDITRIIIITFEIGFCLWLTRNWGSFQKMNDWITRFQLFNVSGQECTIFSSYVQIKYGSQMICNNFQTTHVIQYFFWGRLLPTSVK